MRGKLSRTSLTPTNSRRVDEFIACAQVVFLVRMLFLRVFDDVGPSPVWQQASQCSLAVSHALVRRNARFANAVVGFLERIVALKQCALAFCENR